MEGRLFFAAARSLGQRVAADSRHAIRLQEIARTTPDRGFKDTLGRRKVRNFHPLFE
jgi:hypothetical protein